MAFLAVNVSLQAYIDSNQTEFPEQLISNISQDFEDSAVTQMQSTTIVLAGGASQVITLNGVATVKRWYIFSSATDLTLAINGAAAMTCQASEPGYVPITLSSLTITNADPSVSTTVTFIPIASA